MKIPDWRFGFLVALLAALLLASALSADDNGFDLRDSLVPVDEIHLGGPSRDGIPAIDHPKFVAVEEAGFLDAEDQVLGLVRNGETKAYPIRIMNWHEIVNDLACLASRAPEYPRPFHGHGQAARLQSRPLRGL